MPSMPSLSSSADAAEQAREQDGHLVGGPPGFGGDPPVLDHLLPVEEPSTVLVLPTSIASSIRSRFPNPTSTLSMSPGGPDPGRDQQYGRPANPPDHRLERLNFHQNQIIDGQRLGPR